MLKINQEIKNKFNHLLNILVLILIILFNRTNIVYGADINWFEVSRTAAGVQYLDRDSTVSYTHLTLPTNREV